MQNSHITALKVFDELPFSVGEKTLVEFLKGNPNSTIEKHKLRELKSFGELFKFEKEEIEILIEKLIENNLIEKVRKEFYFIVQRTELGSKEIYEKKLNFENIKPESFALEIEEVSENDKKIFKHFEDFLKRFDERQKKAIISQEKNILCVAGAGSGKTTILTKRIEFLCKYKSVLRSKILAITFTKKAKKEMEKRLKKNNLEDIKVETFNSFCEKILIGCEKKICGEKRCVAEFKDYLEIVRFVFDKCEISFPKITQKYFSKKQIRKKNSNELFFLFVKDIIAIIDIYKNSSKKLDENNCDKIKSDVMFQINFIIKEVLLEFKKKKLRSFSEQLIDVIKIFMKNPKIIPKFDYILIDEFQDINKPQIKLMQILSKKNNSSVFAVGDPRQAIFSWRGSDLQHTLKFSKIFGKSQNLSLTKNYRSCKKIVDFANSSIKNFKFENLENHKEDLGEVFIMENKSKREEQILVSNIIKNSKYDFKDIFVLARTHKILESFSKEFEKLKIPFTIKKEETKEENLEGVILATIHAIKGLEAKQVFLVNCDKLSFPNKVIDNDVLKKVKEEQVYNKKDEEQRLFYVALTRAKENLVITYTKNHTEFIKQDMVKISQKNTIKKEKLKSFIKDFSEKELGEKEKILLYLLKNWRGSKSKEKNLPAYTIFKNETLNEIATTKPKSKEEFLQIKGVGEIKFESYGGEILEILNK